MDDYREEYLEWKKKNETLIERIKKIEQEIDQTQNTLFEKKCYSEYLKEKEERYKQLQQKYQNYDHLFQQLGQDVTTGSDIHLNKRHQQQHGKQRREVSEQLILTPELICHQKERLWKKNKTTTLETVKEKEIVNHQQQEHVALDHIQKNIQRLMQQHTSDQYLSSIENLLKCEIDKTNMNQQALSMNICIQKNHQVEEEDNNVNDTLSKNQKLEAIARQQQERLEYIIQLEQDAERWKNRTKLLEEQLYVETQQKYSDPQIQAAFIESIKAKATKAKAESQILFTKHHIEEMEKISKILKEKHKSIDHLEHDIQTIQEKLNFKKERAINLQLENQEGEKMIQDEHQKVLQLLDEINQLHDGLCNKKLRDDLLTIENIISKKENPDEKILKQIGNELNPSYELEPSHTVKHLENQLFKCNLLSSHEPSKLNNELEALVLSWDDELKEHGIILPESSDEMDAIDTVSQAITTLKEHADRDWEKFTLNQQKLLSSKLDLLEDGSKEVQGVEKLLKERNIIIKGDIGTDYTVQDRNLEEWFQLADDQS